MKNIFFILISLFSTQVVAQERNPYTVFLKEDSILNKLSDQSEVRLSKGIYAQVLEIDPKRRDIFNVYDHTGKALYSVNASAVVEIEDDIRLLPEVDAEKVYPPKSVFKVENKTFQLDSQASLHFEALGISGFNTIYKDQPSSATGSRMEARALYTSEFPVEFGLCLNYQNASWKNDAEDIKLSILSFGPQFKSHFFSGEDFRLFALMSAEVAPVYEGKSQYYNDQYSALLFDAGIESEWPTRWGIFALGGHFRNHQITLTKSNRPNLDLTAKEFSMNSAGITIGYKVEWNL